MTEKEKYPCPCGGELIFIYKNNGKWICTKCTFECKHVMVDAHNEISPDTFKQGFVRPGALMRGPVNSDPTIRHDAGDLGRIAARFCIDLFAQPCGCTVSFSTGHYYHLCDAGRALKDELHLAQTLWRASQAVDPSSVEFTPRFDRATLDWFAHFKLATEYRRLTNRSFTEFTEAPV